MLYGYGMSEPELTPIQKHQLSDVTTDDFKYSALNKSEASQVLAIGEAVVIAREYTKQDNAFTRG